MGSKVAAVRGKENKMLRKKRSSMGHGSGWLFLLVEGLEVRRDMEDVVSLGTNFGGRNTLILVPTARSSGVLGSQRRGPTEARIWKFKFLVRRRIIPAWKKIRRYGRKYRRERWP